MIPRYAVIATHDRPTELVRAVRVLAPQCRTILVIDNASNPPVDLPQMPSYFERTRLHTIRDDEQPPNLSRLWNVGLDFCRSHAATEHGNQVCDIAIVNDDAVPPPDWFAKVANSMRVYNAAAGSSHPFATTEEGLRIDFHGPGEAPGVHNRLTGWAFVLRGETGLRFDESMRWWCGDDDMSMQARRAGGLVHVGGYPVPNTGANSSTVGVLAEQAAKDMQTFVDKWGVRPW
jgi:hypothetical protein